MENEINGLLKNGFLKPLGAELMQLYKKSGSPEPAGGPSTEVRCVDIVIDPGDVGDWGGDEEKVANILTGHREIAYEAINYRHIGSGIVYTDYHSSEQFDSYQQQGYELIKNWFAEDSGEEFDFVNDQVEAKNSQNGGNQNSEDKLERLRSPAGNYERSENCQYRRVQPLDGIKAPLQNASI